MNTPSKPFTEPEDRDLRDPRSLALARSLLEQGLMVTIQVSGQSMRPFLRGGEQVTLAQATSERLRTGDVILYVNRYGMPVLHRITGTTRVAGRLLFRTQGDGLAQPDEPLPAEMIVGKAVAVRWPGRTRAIDLEAPAAKALSRSLAWTNCLRNLRRRLPVPRLGTEVLGRLGRLQAAALARSTAPVDIQRRCR